MFGKKDVGCHADGTFGDLHLREKLRDLAIQAGKDFPCLSCNPETEDTDGAIDRAMDYLQEHTEEGYYWHCDAGDLLLCEEPNE